MMSAAQRLQHAQHTRTCGGQASIHDPHHTNKVLQLMLLHVQQMGRLAIDLHTDGGGTLACSEARLHAANTRAPWVPQLTFLAHDSVADA